MSVERFNLEQFRDVLEEFAAELKLPLHNDGLIAGEYCFHIVVKTFNDWGLGVGLQIRSSIDKSGWSASSGEDSIRCWLTDQDGNPLGNKAQRWVTRLPNWQKRLAEQVCGLVEVAEKIELCPDCGKVVSVFVTKKDGSNKGRWFMKCMTHNHFQWLTDPNPKYAVRKPVVVPEERSPVSKRFVPMKDDVPSCPKCESPMVMRHRRKDNAPFWGCSTFPNCRGTRSYKEGVRQASVTEGQISKPKEFVPSKLQEAIFEVVRNGDGHLVVEAGAGCAKTTTIERSMPLVPRNAKVAFVAFNRHIARELAKRAPRHVKVSTLHSLGFAACRAAWGNDLLVQEDKISKIIESVLDKYVYGHLYATVRKVVSMVKANLTDTTDEDLDGLANRYGIELNGDRNTIYDAVRIAVKRSYDQRESRIDYDDMCWLPVVANLPVRKFDVLFVDEAQDLNKCQIQLVLMSVVEGGRVIAVGDRNQSLYGFRGADVDAIPNIIAALEADTLPLSITYRNPKGHVRLCNETFPNIPLEAAPWAEEGVIRYEREDRLTIEAADGDMVLCRTNAPLVRPAFALIRRGVKATIRGRDIGRNLVQIIRKMKVDSLVDLLAVLAEYRRKETEKLIAAEKKGQAQALQDKVDTIIALADGVSTVVSLEQRIEAVFSDDVEGVVFSSVHRAKGLEAERVWILRPELMPHPMASQPWELVQERNIQYVAYTRSKHELVFVDG